jgi:hypothetical protein
VQRRHNCSPAVSFANCVMTLYLLKVHLQTFLTIPITRKMPDFELWHSCGKWVIFVKVYLLVCQVIKHLWTVFLDRRCLSDLWLVIYCLLLILTYHNFIFRICVCHLHLALGWDMSHQTRVAGVRYPGVPSSGALFKKFGLFLNTPSITACHCMSVSGCSSECTHCSQCSQPGQMPLEYDRHKLKIS